MPNYIGMSFDPAQVRSGAICCASERGGTASARGTVPISTDRKPNDRNDLWIVRLYLCCFVTDATSSPDAALLARATGRYARGLAGKPSVSRWSASPRYSARTNAAQILSRTLTPDMARGSLILISRIYRPHARSSQPRMPAHLPAYQHRPKNSWIMRADVAGTDTRQVLRRRDRTRCTVPTHTI